MWKKRKEDSEGKRNNLIRNSFMGMDKTKEDSEAEERKETIMKEENYKTLREGKKTDEKNELWKN